MPASSPTFNRARFTVYAPVYDACFRRLFRGARAAALAALGLRPGMRVLVAGCGTGLDFPHLPVGVHLTGGDITPAMVRRARQAVEKAGHHGAHLLPFDAARLPFAEGAFDAVVLHFVVAVVNDPGAVMAEAARVLAPAGQVSLMDVFRPPGVPPSRLRRVLNPLLRLAAHDVMLDAADLVAPTPLRVVSDLPVHRGGQFRALRLRKDLKALP